MTYVYKIDYAPFSTTVEDVIDTFNREFEGEVVLSACETIYKKLTKSFVIVFKNEYMTSLFQDNIFFIREKKSYKLFYTPTQYWNVRVITI